MGDERVKTSLINFLLEVCPPILDCSRQELSALLTKRAEEKIRRFLSDQQVQCIVIGKEAVSTSLSGNGGGIMPQEASTMEDEAVNAGGGGEVEYTLFIETTINHKALRSTSVAFIKRPGSSLAGVGAGASSPASMGGGGNMVESVVERAGEDRMASYKRQHIGAQLQIVVLGYLDHETSTLEIAQAYFQQGFAPLLSLSTQQATGGGVDGGGSGFAGALGDEDESERGKTNIGGIAVHRKLTELIMSIQHAQQNIEIPFISLTQDPFIKEIIEKATSQGRKAVLEDLGKKLDDKAYLNQLQSLVNKWIKEMQKIMRLQRDSSSGSAVEEINFWLGLEKALLHIYQQLQTQEVDLTMSVLKHVKKFFATMSLEADTGLKKHIESVTNINILMRDFSIDDLLGATSVEQLTLAVRNIFLHMRKLKSAIQYPLARAYHLVEALSRDLTSKLLKLLSTYNLLQMDYEEFDHATAGCNELFRTWDDEVRQFKDLVREQSKKRGLNERPPAKLVCEHICLQERISELRQFRRQHFKLNDVVGRVLVETRGGELNAQREINHAYKLFCTIDVLDISRVGVETWEAAKKLYDDKIDRAESQITSRLRDRLGSARNSTEMFRVFSQFNALFFRPRIRGAIQEYQCTLIQQVKDDLKKLQSKYIDVNHKAEIITLAQARDVPPVAAAMIWSRQLERRLDSLLKRVEDVLGRGWEQHIEGQKLRQDIDSFRAKLSQHYIYEKWLKQVKEAKKLDLNAKVFGIKLHGGRGHILEVCFDEEVITLFKEVRNLQAMQFRVPYSVKVLADEAKIIYPFAITLQESIHMYTQTCMFIEEEAVSCDLKTNRISSLVCSFQKDVQQKITEGVSLRWDGDRLETFTRKLCELVTIFENKVEEASSFCNRIIELINEFNTVMLDRKGTEFRRIISSVQKLLDEMHFAHFCNLKPWVKALESVVESIFKEKLKELAELWIKQFRMWPNGGTSLISDGSVHELKLQNQQLALSPPVHAAIQRWINDFHTCLGSICLLPRLTSGVNSSLDEEDENEQLYVSQFSNTARDTVDILNDLSQENANKIVKDRTYRHVFFLLPTNVLKNAYNAIDEVVGELREYVCTWLEYQSLWDVELSDVLSRVHDDIDTWQALLNEIKASRGMFDTSDVRKMFGSIVVDYRLVQSKVNTKYESWHKEILNAFSVKVRERIGAFNAELEELLAELEAQGDLESSVSSAKDCSGGCASYEISAIAFLSMSEVQVCDALSKAGGKAEEFMSSAVSGLTKFISELRKCSSKEPQLAAKLEKMAQSEAILERQRYSFPADWLWVDSLLGEFEKFQQVIKHQTLLCDQARGNIENVVLRLHALIQDNLQIAYSDWTLRKPVHGDIAPQQSLATLHKFENLCAKLRAQYDNVHEAVVLLDIYVGVESELFSPQALEEEIQSLKNVWAELRTLYDVLTALKETLWTAAQPKKVRQSLQDLVDNIKKIPAKFRQYEAFENLQEHLEEYLSANSILADLKTDALKDRHWKLLYNKLSLKHNLNDLTLGNLWSANLLKNENIIRQILSQAQGEMALEEFLRQVKSSWTELELDLVFYQNKCNLIRGWDDMFGLIDDHLSALQSMKISPYFKIFEEEATAWDEKLNRLRLLLDSWMELQRKWIYLEGVFTGSSDIQSLLPNEFQRFKSVDSEFLSIMKKTSLNPKVLEFCNIEGFQRQLERLSDLMNKIQKALGEYLEKQRVDFPRFYFVGDEDLLEIIGNSKDVKVVQRHLNKMFAGIAVLHINSEDPDEILGMCSREGELVMFKTPIKISSFKSLRDWLKETEKMMFITLSELLLSSTQKLESINVCNIIQEMKNDKSYERNTELEEENNNNKTLDVGHKNLFFEWLGEFPAQIVLLSLQIDWTSKCEKMLDLYEQNTATPDFRDNNDMQAGALASVESYCVDVLEYLADLVTRDIDKKLRITVAQVITEMVHQRDVIRILNARGVRSKKDFCWLQYMRLYLRNKYDSVTECLELRMANAVFIYGFEYLGLVEKLVQTPLTDKCYLTLTQALHMRLGGNPFGPAGTGKTETVKALGAQLGKFVLVFNCDECFDFTAIGRIFVGLCQVGAWGCFDEFNRLEERILSAVSEQILTIQIGLRDAKKEIEILNKSVKLNLNVGIFVTMNPGYAGRSNLPDNLKQLFREIAMILPDKQLIAQVTLFSQGFRTAERLSSKVISLFDLCYRQLSNQPHYDFGLRSLKSVLNSAGSLKRESLLEKNDSSELIESSKSEESLVNLEQKLLLRSVCDTVVPKLVAEDVPLLHSLLSGVFPGADYLDFEENVLIEEIKRLCTLRYLDPQESWITKILQLYQIQKLQHGVMLVGPVGTGKSAAWQILLAAMECVDNVVGNSYVLDPKAVSKEQLYGKLDSTTLEWTDGVFTSLLRKILYSVHGESSRRHWIIFDGDVDPAWAENLNSVLDDNKLLTLPNGERLKIPPNVRLLFEVETLKYATPATVSRCGMVWFSEDIVKSHMLFSYNLKKIKFGDINLKAKSFSKLNSFVSLEAGGGKESENEEEDEKRPQESISIHDAMYDIKRKNKSKNVSFASVKSEISEIIRAKCIDMIKSYFDPQGFVSKCLNIARSYSHVMVFTVSCATQSMFSLIKKGIDKVLEIFQNGGDMSDNQLEKFITKWLIFSIIWGMGGSLSLGNRAKFCNDIIGVCTSIALPSEIANSQSGEILLDYEPRPEDGEWHHWMKRVSQIDIERKQVSEATLVIETVDTVRHRHVLEGWLQDRKFFILCGPPGSGKTMTLTSVLKGTVEFDIAFLNFSSGTTPDMLLKTFDHYCEYVKTPSGCVLRPSQPGKWLIIFADECNLPSPDKYDTQHVIMFIRQMCEQQGFWRIEEQTKQWTWIKMDRIQFAGACNPPTDVGRHHMSNRFLRHTPILFVDFPGKESLKVIYGTFNRALLKHLPSMRGYASCLTEAMVEFYEKFSSKFIVDMQPHYIYSPRELTRWKLALNQAVSGREDLSPTELVRLYIHEGLRIFQDRLVEEEEKAFTDKIIDQVARDSFPDVTEKMLQRPVLHSSYLTMNYEEVTREDLRKLIEAKMRVFNEEELNVQLVLFDQVLDHITRIDRVLRQPLGHLLLVGASGAGKTILPKFVSWLNGLSVFQIKAGRQYNIAAFEGDLRTVMKRAGIKEEKITFIFDESNVLSFAFLERMNALLASGEVPGLFEGDEFAALMSECKTAYGSDFATDETDLFSRFTQQVQQNLHIVFTMNPANPDFANRQSTSPAIFNRCVVDWFGDWPHEALIQVADEFTSSLEIPGDSFISGASEAKAMSEEEKRLGLAHAIVAIHECVARLNIGLMKIGKKYNYITPRDFQDFIRHFIKLVDEKKDEVVEQQKHLNVGLTKLKETEQQVAELQHSLADKERNLSDKNAQAEEKMQLMVKQQAEAEEKKKIAEMLTKKLDNQVIVIEERKSVINQELSEVEPLLREAEEAVTNIPKRSLDELKALANPPALVKMAVEAVAVLILDKEEQPITWEESRKLLKGTDFINKVIGFDCMNVSPATRKRVQTKYIKGSDWDIDRIMKASKAAGPLSKWAESTLTYASISERVAPLQNEITNLEIEAVDNKNKLVEQQALRKLLEEKLQQYKNDYADLISQVQIIKREMELVQSKVRRSVALLKNLASEKERWSDTSLSLRERTSTLIGDCLIAGAFCTFIGFFEHSDRRRLLEEWRKILVLSSIRSRDELSIVEFLSKPSERLQWVANSLPSDDLSTENAVILRRYIRYPLIIDPSAQATNFLVNEYANKKLAKTSFMDTAFFKNLESALRFGTTLLVQDVEKIDPILNSVLNKETHKQGGRVLITVGDSEIDFSPSFTMFLATRDPTTQFKPDLCSRVTFVNFTLTPSSLQNQCLNLILKNERPDVDARRSDMLKLQGEFRVKIRELEDALLLALSNVKGNILDDDSVIGSMETLKKQAAEVAEESAKTDEIMAEVEQLSSKYLPLSRAASRIFFTLQHMQHLSNIYQYDLHFFLGLLNDSLQSAKDLQNVAQDDYDKRLAHIFKELFRETYRRIAHGLIYEDRIVLALQLARIRAEVEIDAPVGVLLEILLKGSIPPLSGAKNLLEEEDESSWRGILGGKMNAEQMKILQNLCYLKPFKNLKNHMIKHEAEWLSFLTGREAEMAIPGGWMCELSGEGVISSRLKNKIIGNGNVSYEKFINDLMFALVIKALRPDRLAAVLTKLVENILGVGFLWVAEITKQEMKTIVYKQITSSVPVVFISSPGFDPSNKIFELANDVKQTLTSIAMGSEEGYSMAERAINNAAKQGTWVLFKNVHLSLNWLQELEKKLHRMHPSNSFRLFLTMEHSSKIPLNLLRVSYKILFEPPTGLKASLQRSYSTLLTPQRSEKPPAATRVRLHFLLAFLHAVISERKRYVPIGWCKAYEFSDSDQKCALDVVDTWLDASSKQGPNDFLSHINPEKIPWDAIRTLLSDFVYGGRLDNKVDKRLLRSFVDYLFNESALESNFILNLLSPADKDIDKNKLEVPNLSRSTNTYLEWINNLESVDIPTWLGFAPDAEILLSVRLGLSIINKWCTLHLRSKEELQDLLPSAIMLDKESKYDMPKTLISRRISSINSSKQLTKYGSISASSWLLELIPQITGILHILPSSLPLLKRSDASVKNPMFRCFEREVSVGYELLKQIKSELDQLQVVCSGEMKFTNKLRELAQDAAASIVPKSWVKYSVLSNLTLLEWVQDLSNRLHQLSLVCEDLYGNKINNSSAGDRIPNGKDDVKFHKEKTQQKKLYASALQSMVEIGCTISKSSVWLGGLFFPAAYLTATRQVVAQRFNWSLDDLSMEFNLGFSNITDEQSFIIGGLTMEGAAWDAENKCLCLSNELSVSLPPARITWLNKKNNKSKEDKNSKISVPIFLNKTRTELITFASLDYPTDIVLPLWYQRGVAILLWNNS